MVHVWECYIFLLGCGHGGACLGVLHLPIRLWPRWCMLWGVHLSSYLRPLWHVVGWGIHRQVICDHVCKAPKLPTHKPHLHWPRLHDLNQSRHLDQGQGILVYPVTLDKLLKEYLCPWNHPVFYRLHCPVFHHFKRICISRIKRMHQSSVTKMHQSSVTKQSNLKCLLCLCKTKLNPGYAYAK